MSGISVSIDVSDLDQAVDFYTNAMGCKPVEGRNPAIRIVEQDGLRLYLLLRPEQSAPIPKSDSVRSYHRHWTPVHLDFSTSDITTSAAAIERAGGSVEAQLDGIAYCADPFGHGFCIIRE